ncbi:MAG: RIP metalloprotease RseP [Ignavibacteria bacterium]|nr:RIP metalloprotease RseP [Ignavibacteria bacterium]
MDFSLITVFAFILVIGILVFVHELGHFLTAKWTGMRADVFAIGMGPRMVGWNKFTGFSFGPLPKDLDLGAETDYRLCWFPIGGYVKIIGMIDESFDTEHMNEEPKPYEFRSKKNWQKAIVLLAGVTMNMLLALGVYWVMGMTIGDEVHNVRTVGYVESGSVAFEAGFQRGDLIERIDGKVPDSWEDVAASFMRIDADQHTIQVKRSDGTKDQLVVETGDVVRALSERRGLGIMPSGVETRLDAVMTLDPAGKAGLKAGDIVLAIDSTPIYSASQLPRIISARPNEKIVMHIKRADETMPIEVTIAGNGKIGVQPSDQFTIEPIQILYSPLQAFVWSAEKIERTISTIFASVTQVFRGNAEVKDSFGGPIMMMKMAGAAIQMGGKEFFGFMALISISLAVMNLLPMPGLDGGHLVIVAIESVIRRELPTKVKLRIQQVGVALLLMLMAFVIYVDIMR